ncbi:MAG: GFA family protein [Alphaproteobacteria bacterium]|nr:GFA family protein [Alphaproteobacteria bacterium]
MAEILTGGCQCGAIRYEVTGAAKQLLACHCSDCQKQSGSAFGMTMVVDEADFRLVQGTVKKFTARTDAGRSKTGVFCPECGSRLYHELEARKGMVSIKAGTLDDTSGLNPTVHLWTDSKQPWVTIPDGVKAFEKQPF